MTKLKKLKVLIKRLPESKYQNVIAGNSKIIYTGNKYQIWAGGLDPVFEGNYQETANHIYNQIEQQELYDELRGKD